MNKKRIIFIMLTLLIVSSCSKNYGVSEAEKFIDGYKKPNHFVHSAVSFLDPASGLVLHALNLYETNFYKLNDLEKKLYLQALQYSLNHSGNGEITKWYNYERESLGKIMVLYSFYKNDKYCRTYTSLIKLNGFEKKFKKTLCKNKFNNMWEEL